MIKAIAFDLDDTLIDSKRMHHAAIIEALDNFGIKRKRIRWIRGATTEELLRYNIPQLDEKTISKISKYKRKIIKKYIHLAKLLPGAIDLLRNLKRNGLIIGLVTNNSHSEIRHFIKAFKLKKFFDIIVGIDDAKPKPSPDMLRLFMKKTKVKPSETIYVGDSDYDIISSKKAHVKIIVVTKIHKTSMTTKANFIAKNLKDIEDIIYKFKG
jgi:HAD superfamily hydrolase (TIGR01662 family)